MRESGESMEFIPSLQWYSVHVESKKYCFHIPSQEEIFKLIININYIFITIEKKLNKSNKRKLRLIV